MNLLAKLRMSTIRLSLWKFPEACGAMILLCFCPQAICETPQKNSSSEKHFSLKASQFRLGADKSGPLTGRTSKLQPLASEIDANAPKEYKANLQAYKDHANKYMLHLEAVEQQIGNYKQGNPKYDSKDAVKYDAIANTLVLETQMSQTCSCHLKAPPGWEPLNVTSRPDQFRLSNSQAQLSAARGQLRNSIQENKRADAQLMQRSDIAEEERNLSGEFASLQAEYELLKIQREALSVRSAPGAKKEVHGLLKKH